MIHFTKPIAADEHHLRPLMFRHSSQDVMSTCRLRGVCRPQHCLRADVQIEVVRAATAKRYQAGILFHLLPGASKYPRFAADLASRSVLCLLHGGRLPDWPQ